MQQPSRTTQRLATLRIVAIYAFFGTAWILVSDNLLSWLVTDPVILTRVAVFKGWLYVLLTSLLLYKLIIRDNLTLAEATDQLHQSEQRFHTIYDSLNDAIFIHDALSGTILDVNDTACRLYGYTRAEMVNQTLELVGTGAPPYSHAEALGWIQRAAAGQPQTFEWITVAKDQRRFWVEVGMRCAVLNGQDQIIVVVRDITERKQSESQLSEQQKQLEELNRTLEQRVNQAIGELRQKDELLLQQSRHAAMGEMLNNIAHQWRQPLNNIGIYVQNMQMLRAAGELTDEELQNDVQSVMEIVQYMSRTIDDFRTFFRIEKTRQTFALKETVEQALRFVSARMEHHGITCQLEVKRAATVTGFQGEYIQVLLNILNNAIDALDTRSSAGRWIKITLAGDDNRPVLSISDNGGGIPAAALPHIFEPYFTSKGTASGSGIGLYMAKVIIEKHMSGTLTARNTAEGAEFIIELPL